MSENHGTIVYNIRRTIALVLAAAMCALLFAGCGSGEKNDGTRTAESMAECVIEGQDISYDVYLKVSVDKDGKIISVEDSGTKIPEGKDGLYKKAQALFGELAGKTADDLDEIDAVSGATCSSKAILTAVRQALEDMSADGK